MPKFIKYLSPSHLNSMNVALYSDGAEAVLVAENVATDKAYGSRTFPNEEAAYAWYATISLVGIAKLNEALNRLTEE